MKEIFEQYGGVLITVTAIVAVVGVVALFAGGGQSGIIYKAFQSLLQTFFEKAKLASDVIQTVA